MNNKERIVVLKKVLGLNTNCLKCGKPFDICKEISIDDSGNIVLLDCEDTDE